MKHIIYLLFLLALAAGCGKHDPEYSQRKQWPCEVYSHEGHQYLKAGGHGGLIHSESCPHPGHVHGYGDILKELP